MLLGPGETLLRGEYAIVRSADGPAPAVGAEGVLYLTSQRVIFEVPVPRGLAGALRGGRGTRTALEAPIATLRGAAVVRRRLGRERLAIETDRLRATFDVLQPSAWAHAIATARRAGPSAPDRPVERIHTIERQVVKVRCRYCGALGNEVDGRCPSCGAPL